MAITSLDGAIAGMQPTWFFSKASTTTVASRVQSLWGIAGIPGAGSPNTTLAGAALTSNSGGSSLANNIQGQLPWLDPVSGNSYLSRFSGAFYNGGQLLLCDRLWHNGGFTITSTSPQTVNSAAWPARDINGSTNGVGVLIGLEVSGATGAGAPTITINYTNSAGVSGRTGTNTFATAASATAGGFFPIGLQAGDVGVQSVQSMTLSASWTSGTINLVAYRVISVLDCPGSNAGAAVDLVTGGMPQMFNGSVPFILLYPSVGGSTTAFGSYSVTQG